MKLSIRRLFAHAIDLVVSLVVGLLIFGLVFLTAGYFSGGFDVNLTRFGRPIVVASIPLGYVIANSYFLRSKQATVGKMMFGLRINGSKRTSVLLLRAISPVVIANLWAGLAWAMLLNYVVGFGPRKKCGHDYVFGTEVVSAQKR